MAKPWRHYACYAAATFALSLIKSGPARSLNAVMDMERTKNTEDERKRAAERRWQYIKSHPIRGIKILFVLKGAVGFDWFREVLNDTRLTFSRDQDSFELGKIFVAAHAPNTEEHSPSLDHPVCAFWEIYKHEPGFWYKKINPSSRKFSVVAGFDVVAPWSALGIKNIEKLEDISLLTQISKPMRSKSKVARYTDDELSAIFAELDRRTREGFRNQSTAAWVVYRELFFCMYYTGLRVGDTVRLQWENVSLPFSTMQITQEKTHKLALIRVPSEYRARLQRLAQERGGNPTGLVYPNTAGGMVTQANLDAAIRAVLRACGLVKKSPLHSFRHTVAMRLLDAGLPIHEVANQLGDSIATVTRAYLKPQIPTQATVDVAFQQSQLSRKRPADYEETAVFGAINALTVRQPNG